MNCKQMASNCKQQRGDFETNRYRNERLKCLFLPMMATSASRNRRKGWIFEFVIHSNLRPSVRKLTVRTTGLYKFGSIWAKVDMQNLSLVWAFLLSKNRLRLTFLLMLFDMIIMDFSSSSCRCLININSFLCSSRKFSIIWKGPDGLTDFTWLSILVQVVCIVETFVRRFLRNIWITRCRKIQSKQEKLVFFIAG